LNLLFQLHNDYRSEKKYVGIDAFIHMSSGIIRNVIEVCNQALNTAYNYGYEPNSKKPVDFAYQDMGAKHHAELQYNDITRVPGNLGMGIQDFINQIGTIFRELHLNRYLVEPEPTHFETDYSEITGEAKAIFDAALDYSYLQQKPSMDPKSSIETKKNDFLINRVFAPHFEISYRVRGRTSISAHQITTLITGNDKRKKKERQNIIRENTRREKPGIDLQRELFDRDQIDKNETD